MRERRGPHPLSLSTTLLKGVWRGEPVRVPLKMEFTREALSSALLGSLANAAIFLIRIYQFAISPLIPPSCRFYPSCSHYAAEAIRRHGMLRGSALAAWRLAKCQPLHPGGFDPVPGSAHPESC